MKRQLTLVVAMICTSLQSAGAYGAPDQVRLSGRHKPLIEREGLTFRDLNGDDALSPYEDWRLPAADRARDLVSRMTLDEKLGSLLHGTLQNQANPAGVEYDMDAARVAIRDRHVSSFISRLVTSPTAMAAQSNAIQELAEQTRLGVPLTLSSDPRNHFKYVPGASEVGGGFSKWPEALGFAAIGDAGLVRRFADIARQEYRAVGLHVTLSPQADLATEPRWPRQIGTFGSDANVVRRLTAAYVEGFQGGPDGIAPNGVFSVIKHFVGYGAQPEGFDAHSYYGRFADLDDEEFANHVSAFADAIAANVGFVMPAYPILRGPTVDGRPVEPVGAGFSSTLINGLLRRDLGFDGVVLSDWSITQDCGQRCMAPTAELPQTAADIATPWGAEHLSPAERFALGIRAGIDQFGGVDDPQPIAEAFAAGLITQEQVDRSVIRIMTGKFALGLFENPYVSVEAADETLGRADFIQSGLDAQRRSQVLLQNKDSLLPITRRSARVYLHGVDPAAARAVGLSVADDPADADFAIIRAETPSELLHPHFYFGRIAREGRLDFRPGDPSYDALLYASASVPTVFAVFLDRPPILTDVQQHARAILANFGASDAALMDVIIGKYRPEGRLPLELPSSMDSVRAQRPGKADDSREPLYPSGAGLHEESYDR